MRTPRKTLFPCALPLRLIVFVLILLGPVVSLSAQIAAADAAMVENLRRVVLSLVSWIFLIVGLLLVVLALRRTYLWLAALRRSKIPPTRYFTLQLQVQDRRGHLSLHNFDYYPVVVATAGNADLLLPGLKDERARFSIGFRDGAARLSSPSSLLINGVPRQRKDLKTEDRVIFGPYRVVFKEASIQEHSAPLPGKPMFAWQFPIVALLLALAVLFRQAAVPEDTMLLAKAARMQSAAPVERSEAARPAAKRDPAAGRTTTVFRRPNPVAVAPVPPPAQTPEAVAEAPKPVKRAEPVRPAVATAPAPAHAPVIPTAMPAAVAVAPAAAAAPAPAAPPEIPPPMDRRVTAAVQEPVEVAAEVPQPHETDAAASAGQQKMRSVRRAELQTAMLEASVLASVVPAAVHNNGINPLEDLSIVRERSIPQVGRTKVRVVGPNREVPYFKADVLFIHAHPDDESIDFGSLMARASRCDRRIVTLLFTDGESGLDLYPERKVGDIYPARDLTGGALSQVRVVEATRALSILGSEMYIRWGLENRPYNSKRDELPPDEVIAGWGGEEPLVEKLIEVLEGFRPSIVVSPDRHSKAYEHFEHEAVGQLVQTALERLRASGRNFIKAHIVSVDPHQVDRYTGLTVLDAVQTDDESGLSYRKIQTLALKEHVTQRDAAVIAVNRLSQLSEEYYKTIFWNLDESLEDYLR